MFGRQKTVSHFLQILEVSEANICSLHIVENYRLYSLTSTIALPVTIYPDCQILKHATFIWFFSPTRKSMTINRPTRFIRAACWCKALFFTGWSKRKRTAKCIQYWKSVGWSASTTEDQYYYRLLFISPKYSDHSVFICITKESTVLRKIFHSHKDWFTLYALVARCTWLGFERHSIMKTLNYGLLNV